MAVHLLLDEMYNFKSVNKNLGDVWNSQCVDILLSLETLKTD